MRALKAKIDSKQRTVEQDVQSHLESVKKRIAQDRARKSRSRASRHLEELVEERKAASDEKIADWKAKLKRPS